MNYLKINECDIANGDGVRVSLFVSGCRRHCKGCFNPETWDFDAGKPFSNEAMHELLDALKNDWISGLSILGGEPLELENIETVTTIVKLVNLLYPKKTIWLYTGYEYEHVKDKEIMDYIDVLVDGEFIEEKKNITLKFRGSENQRLIDMKRSREEGKVVLYRDK